jgi:uncharacterized protein YbjT (DUF2867 family)
MTTLVLGGNGKTGRRVAERLRARDLPVRIGSRTGEPPFDWEDRSTWAPALRDTSAAYISYYPDVSLPSAPAAIAALAEVAVASGTRRLVLLSGRGEVEAQRAEVALADSGIPEWTVVRASWFMQNFSESYFLDGVLAGEVALPGGSVPVPWVDVDDIADVAVAALTEDGHNGHVYDVTGPRALTVAELVAEIGRATGRDLSYVPLTTQEYAAGAIEAGVPDDIAELLVYLFDEVMVESNADVADGVQRAIGRAPRDVVDYARDAAASGVWSQTLAA